MILITKTRLIKSMNYQIRTGNKITPERSDIFIGNLNPRAYMQLLFRQAKRFHNFYRKKKKDF